MLALVVDVPEFDVELASDALWALGVVAIEERRSGAGRVELWTSLGDDRVIVLDAVAGFPEHWESRLEEVDEAVADTWREHAVATWVDDDLVICPSWVDTSFPEGVTVLTIEPGSTFGMGDHPTTLLSTRALRRVVQPASGTHVLDVGCGSGVLAIAAVRFGAEHADAIDISPAAEAMANENARRNGVGDRIVVSTTLLHEVVGSYEVVVANILAPTLVELSVELLRVLAPGGSLIISGILADRHAHVLQALSPLRVVQVDELDGWAAVTLQR
jgi:ribosomal protein L11 methyltransferase